MNSDSGNLQRGGNANLQTEGQCIQHGETGQPAAHQEKSGKDQKQIAQLIEANEHLVLSALGAWGKQENAEAEKRKQTEFLSMLAHELRNPLQPIAHAAALLGHLVVGNEEQGRLQAIIVRQVEHMARMVDDLLDISRISNGKISLEKTALLLSDLISVALELAEPRIKPRHQTICVVQPERDIQIYADRVRLAQVFSNLLNNAAKFSPEGEVIELKAQVLGQEVRITVRDHGMGIPPELLPVIFDLFTQGRQALDRAHGGLGIGLTLVKTLVELHGGTVAVQSEGTGLGALFTVTLPLAMDEMVPPISTLAKPPALRALRIMIVEDNNDANDSMCMFLELSGHTVFQEYDGISAVDRALVAGLDFLICDIGLPGADGFKVVAHIKAALQERAPVCIATSGYSPADDGESESAYGFDYYLVKPVALDMLLELMEKHVH